uniref:NR LBD domain-containing protein n=1 Tax=Caenorhabditis tropicalis TaxID=1561998 RepID=A0A1I7UWJ7_9PELO
MGMSSNNVQWHRDVNAIDKKFKKLKSQEPSDEDEDPSVPSTSKPKETVENKETLNRQSSRFTVDYDSIEIEVQRIFRTDFPSTSHEHFGSFGPLHKFTEWLKMIRKLQKSKEIVFENRLTEEFLIPHWKEQAKNIAVLFMHCTVFREFSLMEKCRFFKKLWKSVYRIDKIHTSVEVFGDDFVNEKILVISSDRAIQMNDLFFDFDWISDDELEAMLQSVLDYSDKLISVIGRPLCQLNLSIEEFSFLILNFMFSNEEQIPECFIELRDKFLHSISDELHDYYQKNNVLNYASRISNIMKVVHAMRKIHHDDLAVAANIRCQACRYQKCIEVGMNTSAMKLKDDEKKTLNLKILKSKETIANNIVQTLIHVESGLEKFRISAYNPNYYEMGTLIQLLECENRLSVADRFGPMPGWPLQREQICRTEIAKKSMTRDIPDTQPQFSSNKKLWMLYNTFTTIEYIKTFDFFNRLDMKDRLILAGHVSLICTYFHMAYFGVSKKIDCMVQPDGSECPQKDESHYELTTIPMAPLIRLRVELIEYILLKAICVCNPTVQNLSEHAQIILTRERQRYAEVLFDYCQKTRNNGPNRYVELLGVIPVLEQQQHISKTFFILRIAPILAKYQQTALFFTEIMYS